MKGLLKTGGFGPVFKVATWLSKGCATMNIPFGRTTDWASPICVHPLGAAMQVQLFATGS